MDDERHWLHNARPRTDGAGELEILPVAGKTPLDDLEPASAGDAPDLKHRNRRALLAAAATLLLLVGAAAVLGDGGTRRRAENAAAPSAAEGSSSPATMMEPSSTATAARSLRATPARNLLDADLVTARAEGFAPRTDFDISVCVTAGPLIQGCDVSTLASVGTDVEGRIEAEVAVARTILVDGSPVDCAKVTCALAIASAEDPDAVELTPLTFKSGEGPAPVARITPLLNTDLSDGQHVAVSGEGFAGGARVTLFQCIVGRAERFSNCREPVAAMTTIADAEGQIAADVRLSRLLPTEDGWLDCAALDEGRCVVLADTLASSEGPSERRIAQAVELAYDPESALAPAGLDIERPLDGLVDGARVSLSVTAPVGQLPEPPIVEICALEATTECVPLPLTRLTPGGRSLQSSLILPRRFRTTSSAEHDCVETGPCELVLTTAGRRTIQGLEFDPTLPPRGPITPTIAEEDPLAPGQYLTVDLPLGTHVRASQCVTDLADDVCEGYGSDETGQFADADSSTLADGRTRIRVFRRMETQLGRHDCIEDGPCELRFFAPAAASIVQPVPLRFDPAAPPLEGPRVTVTPVADLVDGGAVRVGISGLRRRAAVRVRLCPATTLSGRDCPAVHVDAADTDGMAQVLLRLPRLLVGRWDAHSSEPRIADCAEESCVLRVTQNRFRNDVELDFDINSPLRPQPRLELLDNPPVRPLDRVRLRVHGFVPVGPDEPPGVRWTLCDRPPASVLDLGERCGTTSVPGGLALDEGGTVTGSVTIPVPNLRTPDTDRPIDCRRECWIVVAAGTFERIAVAPIELDLD